MAHFEASFRSDMSVSIAPHSKGGRALLKKTRVFSTADPGLLTGRYGFPDGQRYPLFQKSVADRGRINASAISQPLLYPFAPHVHIY